MKNIKKTAIRALALFCLSTAASFIALPWSEASDSTSSTTAKERMDWLRARLTKGTFRGISRAGNVCTVNINQFGTGLSMGFSSELNDNSESLFALFSNDQINPESMSTELSETTLNLSANTGWFIGSNQSPILPLPCWKKLNWKYSISVEGNQISIRYFADNVRCGTRKSVNESCTFDSATQDQAR